MELIFFVVGIGLGFFVADGLIIRSRRFRRFEDFENWAHDQTRQKLEKLYNNKNE